MIEMSYSNVMKDISIITWPGKNRRSEQRGIWESEFGLLRGNFFAGRFAGMSPQTELGDFISAAR